MGRSLAVAAVVGVGVAYACVAPQPAIEGPGAYPVYTVTPSPTTGPTVVPTAPIRRSDLVARSERRQLVIGDPHPPTPHSDASSVPSRGEGEERSDGSSP